MNIRGRWFLDDLGRATLLRGVNLAGNSKMPVSPDGRTHLPDDFSRHRMVSFVNRPFPLREAKEHLGRLRHWGFNCLRLLTTWEAIEHAGPGLYDDAYLFYLSELVRMAGEFDFYVFIDPHQDVWSRMSGGSGAPGWTLELAGFDVGKLDASEAALTMPGRYPDYGTMVWASNRKRLASCTMFTLFFAGERFAPQLRIGEENIQAYLQRHFIGAMQQVAQALGEMDHVLGYDSLNEPSPGYIGMQSLCDTMPIPSDGPLMSAFESMVIPAGFTRTVPRQVRDGAETRVDGTLTLNPEGVVAWHSAESDVWRQHGVWDVDERGEPVLLREDYFAGVDFFGECVLPFMKRYGAAMRAEDPDAILFVEGQPYSQEPMALTEADSAEMPRIVNASHWYDLLTKRTKQYDPEAALGDDGEVVHGNSAVIETYKSQIGRHVARSRNELGDVPTLLGEFGVPFDINDGNSFESGKFRDQTRALTAYYDVIDELFIHSTIWNYTPDNSNEWGDGWNGEDFSIFSRDQQTTPNMIDSGGRGLLGFCRPTMRACAGTPVRQSFNLKEGVYELVILPDLSTKAPTEVYVPQIQFLNGFGVWVSAGRIHYHPQQLIAWQCQTFGEQTLIITREV